MDTDEIAAKELKRRKDLSLSASIASALSTFSHQPSTLVTRVRCRIGSLTINPINGFGNDSITHRRKQRKRTQAKAGAFTARGDCASPDGARARTLQHTAYSVLLLAPVRFA